MPGHPIFQRFSSVECEASGIHLYDFVGSGSRVSFRRGWEKHAFAKGRVITPPEPPKNEHYLDWIGLLRSVDRASGTFRMAELGAGFAPWVVRGALAARQNERIDTVKLLAIEADPTHYAWILQHFEDNGIDPDQHLILQGAAAGVRGTVKFPVVDDPDTNYGAGIAAAKTMDRTIEVDAFTVPELIEKIGAPLDFLHVDIQGAEYEALPPAMDTLSSSVKSIMVGTHQSDQKHDGLVDAFKAAGWVEVINLARNRLHQTPWGDITVDDGFVLLDNPKLVSSAQ